MWTTGHRSRPRAGRLLRRLPALPFVHAARLPWRSPSVLWAGPRGAPATWAGCRAILPGGASLFLGVAPSMAYRPYGGAAHNNALGAISIISKRLMSCYAHAPPLARCGSSSGAAEWETRRAAGWRPAGSYSLRTCAQAITAPSPPIGSAPRRFAPQHATYRGPPRYFIPIPSHLSKISTSRGLRSKPGTIA